MLRVFLCMYYSTCLTIYCITVPSVIGDLGLSNVREATSDSDFQRHLDAAGSGLVVVDFSTDW